MSVEQRELKELNIVVVDAYAPVAEMTAKLLAASGAVGVAYIHHEDAAQYIFENARRVDLLIVGLGLDNHGLNFARAVKLLFRKHLAQEMPVVLMSGRIDPDLDQVLDDAKKKFDMDAFLPKPFNLERLLDAVNQARSNIICKN